MKNLSVAIIAKNEEKRLPDCLKSVFFAGDIVVVDSGSSDKTVEIAEEFGCRVYREEWKGYGPQKNSALDKCRNGWVLLLDADERLTPEAREAIERTTESQAAAFRLKRKNFLHGRWMKHSGFWPDWQIRLIDRTRGSFEGKIHERWVTDGPVVDLDACIEHYAFSGYSDMLKTLDEYSTVIAGELYMSGKRANSLSPLCHGAGMFIKIYFLERGIIDGMDGFVTALLKAGGSFFKYAKLLELQQRNRTK